MQPSGPRYILWPAAGLLYLSLGFAASAAEKPEIYRWVDENGVTHFSARPPANQSATVVTPDSARIGTVKPAPAAEATMPEPAAAPADKPEEPDPEAIARNCEKARNTIARVEPRPHVVVQDENGEARRLSDSERLQLLDDARAFLSDNC